MKKFLLIGLIVGIALLVIGGAGVVFDQVTGNAIDTAVTVTTGPNGNKIVQQFENGVAGPQSENGFIIVPGDQQGDRGIQINPGPGGMMGGNRNGYSRGGMMGGEGRGGMMGGRGIGHGAGVLHNYMISAFASAVGLTVDEVNTRLAKGETPAQIAIAQGKTESDLTALWLQVRQDALKQAVTAGVITQAQADKMLERMKNVAGPGFGPGSGDCPMWDGNETQP